MYNLLLLKKRKKLALRSSIALLTVGILGLVSILQVQEQRRQRRTEEIYAALGSRNSADFVKPDEDTVLLDSLSGYASPKILDNLNKAALPHIPSHPHISTEGHHHNAELPPAAFALIVVLSHIAPETEIRRKIIRQTWATWANRHSVQVVFFVGVPENGNYSLDGITQEANQYGDIILDDVVDTYYGLTVKMLRILKWFSKTYPEGNHRPKYFIKADHDVFVHIPNLIRHLKAVQNNPEYIGGLLYDSPEVVRNGGDKWYVPRELWEQDYFPAYVGGPCYFVAGSVVPRLYETGLQERLFHLEDVFLTGIVAKTRLGIQLQGVPKHQMPFRKPLWYECIPEDFICAHPVDPIDMLKYFLDRPNK